MKFKRVMAVLASMMLSTQSFAYAGVTNPPLPATKVVKPVYVKDISLPISTQRFLWEQCKKYEVPYHVALAVIHIETGGTFATDLVSKTNDYGLFQINKVHHEWLYNAGCTNLLKPSHNIVGGLMILRSAIKRTETLEQALVMYNRGSGSAKKLFAQGIYSTSYSRKVLKLIKLYK